MASNNAPVSAQQPTMRNVLKMSEDEIKKQIRSTHNQTKQKLDFDPFYLFDVVKNILNPSIIVVDNIVQGKTKDMGKGNQGESSPKACFISPCILKQLSYEMACKGPGEEIACKTTISILKNILSSYPWHVKAVLTLASFALDYGEFSHLADQIDSSDQLTKSLGILKQVPIVLGRQGIEKYKNSFGKLNNLIKSTLDVVECIVELEKRIDGNNTMDVPELSLAIENMSINVFWTIITIVDCMARIYSLINDKDSTQELLPFNGRITSILKSLTDQIALCDQQLAEIKAYLKFKRDLDSLQDIMEFFKKLFFSEELLNLQPATLSNNELSRKIEELRKMKVLLFFSDIDISEKVISILKPICEDKSKKDQYKIVWIQIVKNWTDRVQSKCKVSKCVDQYFWHVVRHFSSVLGIKYVKEQWRFKDKPIVVVLSSEAKVEHENAFNMIETWGTIAYPFTFEKERELRTRDDWFGSCIDFIPDVSIWMKGNKYIFLYGGKETWIKKFQDEATKVKNDPDIGSKEISIELFDVGKAENGKDYLGIFLKNLYKLFFSKSQKETELDKKTKEIQMLLSYMNDCKGWVVLCKGHKLVFSGKGKKVVTALESFKEWKQGLCKGTVFELLLNQRYNQIILPVPDSCCEFKAETNAGWVHGDCTKCPECSEIMEMSIIFKCCHEGHPTKAVNQEKVAVISNTCGVMSLTIRGSHN